MIKRTHDCALGIPINYKNEAFQLEIDRPCCFEGSLFKQWTPTMSWLHLVTEDSARKEADKFTPVIRSSKNPKPDDR
jgi:hypothetical protein